MKRVWFVLLLALLSGAALAKGLKELTPRPAPQLALPALGGDKFDFKRLRGKVVLVNFWATWCPPCLKEIPGFIRLQEKYGKAGLQFVGISVDNPEAVARFWQDMKINYPLLLADDTTYDLMAAYGNARGGLPYSVLISIDGTIVATRLGAYDEVELENILQPLLAAKKPSSR